MWQAIRASSAAPGYFAEYALGSDLHQVSHPCDSLDSLNVSVSMKANRVMWEGSDRGMERRKLYSNLNILFQSFFF